MTISIYISIPVLYVRYKFHALACYAMPVHFSEPTSLVAGREYLMVLSPPFVQFCRLQSINI